MMQSKFDLGEMVLIEGRIVMVKVGYSRDGEVQTTYGIDIPNVGRAEYREQDLETEGVRRIQQ